MKSHSQKGETLTSKKGLFDCLLFRALKYLTKKYLKKHNVRDWLRVVAPNNDHKYYDVPIDFTYCLLVATN